MPPKAEAASGHLHLELASTFDHLEQAVEKAEAFVASHTDDDDLAYRVVLLTSESVTNAMEHGNQWDASKRVIVDLTADAERIEVSVFDEGLGFELSSLADPLQDRNLLNGRGRGLFLMEHMANELHLEQNGCLLRLVFYRAS